MWNLGEGTVSSHTVAHALIMDTIQDNMKSASKHYLGEGLQHGVDWRIPLSLTRVWIKYDDYPRNVAYR